VVDPLMLPDVAWMAVFPAPMAVTKPPLVTVATAVELELQVTELKFCVLPSL